ncbi:MAG: NADH-dependent [FeFe] hydrogenase, group A6 [Bacillota bacterium]|uniref:NADH-quinone oxidoreductase subunit G n=2 Tax=[Clostridium] aminophilum TaxID=1526 RepID=A0A1I6KEQ1_9FIRM|nr:NADH-dependent [FeFe] hydrogenase, group A6 [[Clostridium] aminophilum]MDT3844505.1 NADH-dependent [FeFe] hydrogenase, group A6 [Bacillota bacterium]SFR89719.1 NADH-quinone oxidoreductase subunit G [[Clostridium] aminophilum]
MVKVTIDGRDLEVAEGTTILDAAAMAGIHIPTLCFMKGLNEIGACRVCVVEVEGYERLFTACNNPVQDGMQIHTNTKKVRDARKTNVELILSEHDTNCAICNRSGNCQLQKVANSLNIFRMLYERNIPKKKSNVKFPLIRDYDKCIKCMRCIQVCDKIQNTNVWDLVNTGSRTTVDVTGLYRLEDADCVLCGQCITHCPVGALRERDDTDRVLEALEDPDRITIAQVAPAIRTAWGESFKINPEFATFRRIVGGLRKIGFDYVFDTDFSADLTIMEEASELLEKVKHPEGQKFPMFTSCCPGWVRYCKSHYPEFVDNLSTAKSPMEMFGALIKTYYANLLGVDPAKIFVVAIMPCVAKKAEAEYPSMKNAEGDPDVDVVLTTREIARLIRADQIDVTSLPESDPDLPLGVGSGAGNIFGATGGVMEAALRTAYYMVNGKNPKPDAFKSVRGMKGWKEEEFELGGKTLKVAVVSGLGNANELLRQMKQGRVSYDFVEVMACPGGCVGGGGQPIREGFEMASLRAPILYMQDSGSNLRFSHENPSIKQVYQDFLGAPLSEKAEELLHTNHHDWRMPNER